MKDLTPSLPYPLPPWRHRFTRLMVWAEADEAAIRRCLPPELELREPVVEFAAMYFASSVPERPYYDAAVVAPVRHGGVDGGYWLHGFTSTDQVLSGTRELWGYSMKLADKIALEQQDGGAHGWVERLGVRLFEVTLTPSDERYEPPQTFPRLFLKQIPRADRPQMAVRTVVLMAAETQVEATVDGTGSIIVRPSRDDPVHELAPRRILGASVVTGEQVLPWGKRLR